MHICLQPQTVLHCAGRRTGSPSHCFLLLRGSWHASAAHNVQLLHVHTSMRRCCVNVLAWLAAKSSEQSTSCSPYSTIAHAVPITSMCPRPVSLQVVIVSVVSGCSRQQRFVKVRRFARSCYTGAGAQRQSRRSPYIAQQQQQRILAQCFSQI